MDQLNLQPDALGTSDTTQEIEGYDAHIEQIENAYPEEDFKTPAEQQAEQAIQQQAGTEQADPATEIANQVVEQLSPVSEEEVAEVVQTPEEIEAQNQAEKEQRKAERTKHLTSRVYDPETGDVQIDSILDWEGRKISELPNGKDIIKALKLTRDYSDKE